MSKFLPAYKSTTVMVAPAANAAPGSPVSMVAARRPITVRDLMTHTSGVSYGGNAATRPLYRTAGFDDWYFADKAEPIGVWIDKLATLPFDGQPGESYIYGYNTDILGAVVEKASGQPLDQFFKTRIFDPLKMKDTQFFLRPDQRDRFAVNYAATPELTIVRAPDTGRNQGAYVDGPRAAFSGGAGLTSTAGDYARFLQMLLNGGELDGARILSPKTVALMTSNHVGSLYAAGQLRLRPRLRDHRARRAVGPAGLGRRVRLGRRLRHQVLGGSRGEAGRRVHDPAPAVERPRHQRQAARAPLRRDRGARSRSSGP